MQQNRNDVFLMIRRKKTTIFIDVKEETSVLELKRMIAGIIKVQPEDQKLYKDFKNNEEMKDNKNLGDYDLNAATAKAELPATIALLVRIHDVLTVNEFLQNPVSPYLIFVAARRRMPEIFEGKWDLVSNCGLFDFLAKLGESTPEGTPITLEWRSSPAGEDLWSQVEKVGNDRTSYVFKFGEEFEHLTAAGQQSISTITFVGNTLTQVQEVDDLTVVTTRIFSGCLMETRIEAREIDCCVSACFKKCC